MDIPLWDCAQCWVEGRQNFAGFWGKRNGSLGDLSRRIRGPHVMENSKKVNVWMSVFVTE